jgi:ribose/xylose/arabinose/galactoside ABC-type transport system permease subunit
VSSVASARALLSGSAGNLVRTHARNGGLLVCLIVSVAFVSSRSPTYLSYDNLLVVGLQMAFIGIAALGTTALIIGGYVDLSIGSIYAVCAAASAIFSLHVDPWIALPGGVLLGGLIGLVNGVMVWRIPISPIIITLGSMTLLHGFDLLLK